MRRLLVAIAVLGAVLVPAAPAAAAVTAEFALGVLTVSGDGEANTIVVECVSRHVRVNDETPIGGRVRCSDVETTLVRARAGDDRVVLADLDRANFTILLEVGVFGEEGDDTLIGSALADRLDGGTGADTLRGGAGVDVLVPGAGGGAVAGGLGLDRAVVSGGGDWSVTDRSIARTDPAEEYAIGGVEAVTVRAGGGDDSVMAAAFSGALLIDAGGGDDILRGGSGDDVLLGKPGDDRAHAGRGDDRVEGGDGRDALEGGKGDDQLLGGLGDDTCAGGPGADSKVSC